MHPGAPANGGFRSIVVLLGVILLCISAVASCSRGDKEKAETGEDHGILAVALQAGPAFSLKKAGNEAWYSCGLGTPVANGDSVWVPEGSSTGFMVSGSSAMITLSGSSVGIFSGDATRAGLHLIRGELQGVRIARGGLKITTPLVEIECQGNQSSIGMSVEDGGTTRVTAVSGGLMLKNGAGELKLPEGGYGACSPGEAPYRDGSGPAGTTEMPSPGFSSFATLQVQPYFQTEAMREEAEYLAESKLMIQLDDPWAYINLARTQVDLRKLEEARSNLLEAMELDPELEQVYEGLGTVNLLEGNWAEAAEAFGRARSFDPDSMEALSGLAQAAIGRGDLENAETWLDRLLEVSPGYPPALVGKGIVSLLSGDPAGAKTYVMKAVSDETASLGNAHLLDAILSLHSNDPLSAIEALGSALEGAAQFSQARNLLGSTRLCTGDVAGAASAFRKLSEGAFASDVSTGKRNCGVLDHEAGDSEGALDKWNEAIGDTTDPVGIRMNMAIAMLELSDHDGATAALNEIAVSDPGFWLPREWMARACLRNGAADEAIGEAGAAISLNPSAWISHLVTGRAQKQLGMQAEGDRSIESAKALMPSVPLSRNEKTLLEGK